MLNWQGISGRLPLFSLPWLRWSLWLWGVFCGWHHVRTDICVNRKLWILRGSIEEPCVQQQCSTHWPWAWLCLQLRCRGIESHRYQRWSPDESQLCEGINWIILRWDKPRHQIHRPHQSQAFWRWWWKVRVRRMKLGWEGESRVSYRTGVWSLKVYHVLLHNYWLY